MIYFSSLFAQANSDHIEYNGKIVNAYNKFDLKGRHRIKVKFLSTNSKYVQAIVLSLVNFRGNVYLNGERIMIKKTAFPKINFWQDTAPKEFEIEIDLSEGSIGIFNGADPIGDKRFCKFGSDGCAMIIEDLGKKKIYHCNDFENDDDFDDLVFEMEVLN